MDHSVVYPDVRAVHGRAVPPKILHHDTGWLDGWHRRRPALVCQVHLLDGGRGSVCHAVGRCPGRPRHEILRPVFHVLPDGAGLGQFNIICRCVRPPTKVDSGWTWHLPTHSLTKTNVHLTFSGNKGNCKLNKRCTEMCSTEMWWIYRD